jgi:hypothetical protein
MVLQRTEACGLERPDLTPEPSVAPPTMLHAWRPAWDCVTEGYGQATEPREGGPGCEHLVRVCIEAWSA